MIVTQTNLDQLKAGSASAAPEKELVLVFGPVSTFDRPDFVEKLRSAYPDQALVGCTTAGEINGEGVHDGACVITHVKFEKARFRVATSEATEMERSETAGSEIGTELKSTDLKGVLVFGKGVAVNGSAVIAGLNASLGADVPISGGLAGDNGAFTRTLTLTPDGVFADKVVAVGFYGSDVSLGHGSFGGWQAFGPSRKVTRSDGNILYELDGLPALNLYKEYLGEYAKDLPGSGLLFPFEMVKEDQTSAGIIRTILGIDEEKGSLILAGDIDPKGFLRLMHASTDGLIDGAETAAKRVTESLGGRPSGGLAVLVSCIGRKLVMGDAAEEEVEAVARELGKSTILTGFYSNGEIAPFTSTTDCKLHNQTMTVTFIGEK